MARLTARKVETIRAPGLYGDGDGLYLRVRSGGARYWALRITMQGTRRELGLGPYPALSLADAREKARQWCREIVEGRDPRDADKRDGLTLREAAAEFHAAHADTWVEGHAKRWLSQLDMHVFAKIGDRQLDDIAAGDLLDVLAPLWTDRNDTAGRLLQRIGAIYERAAATGRYQGANPTAGIRRALPKVRTATKHMPAMPWQDVPEFYARLIERESVAAAALAFSILTAARPGEARGALWSEIDLEANTWTIPPERMKARRAHVVPLTDPALAVLDRMQGLSPELVFVSPQRAQREHTNNPLSNMAIDALLRRMGITEATPHGFRTSFRTWCGDHGVDRELAELSLAHRIGSSVEQAYSRSDLLDRRRAVMARWADHVTGAEPQRVVELRR